MELSGGACMLTSALAKPPQDLRKLLKQLLLRAPDAPPFNHPGGHFCEGYCSCVVLSARMQTYAA